MFGLKSKPKKNKKTFYDSSLPSALRQTQEYGVAMTMPELIALRLDPEEKDSWNNWYTANSGHFVGRDNNGIIGKKGAPVAIIAHGVDNVLSPDRIESAYKDGLTHVYGAKMSQTEIDALLGQKRIISFDQLKKQGNLNHRQSVIVMPLDEAAKALSDYQDVDGLHQNHVFAANVGGPEIAEAYVQRLKDIGKSKYGSWHVFNKVDADKPQGRLLFLDNYDGDGVDGYDDLSHYGRFVGVREAPKVPKHATSRIARPSLEEVLRAVKHNVPKSLHPVVRKQLESLYQKYK